MKSRDFPIRSVMRIALSLLVAIFVVLPSITLAAKFSEATLCGDYAFSMNGWVTSELGPAPLWGTGVMTANGKGRLKNAEATFNIFGGCVVLNMAGKGKYSVNSNGTGTGFVVVAPTAPPVVDETCNIDPSLLGGDSAKFEFALTAIGEDSFDMAGTAWKDADDNSVLPFGGSGQAQRQGKRPKSCK
jgi:hypothetical protein